MRPIALLVLVPFLLLLSALRAAPADSPPGAAILDGSDGSEGRDGRDGPVAHAIVARESVDSTITLEGRLVPADADELSFSPRAWSGDPRFVEVVPHGTVVNAGDLVARFDVRELDREVGAAERALAAAQRAQAATGVRTRLAAERAVAEVARLEADLVLARASLAGWRERGLTLDRVQRDLGAAGMQHAIEDMQDELTQLEAMYRDDELVEATEEIVLKRSRRDLAQMRKSAALGVDRRAYEEEYTLPERTAAQERAVESSARTLEERRATAEIDKAERQATLDEAARTVDEARERLADLRADRADLELRAPRRGVVLHGGWSAWAPGATRSDHRVGGRGALRDGLFLVAEPDRLAVSLTVDAVRHARLRPGAGVEVETVWGGRGVGRLSVSPIARPDGSFVVRAELERPLVGHAAGSPATLKAPGTAGASALLVPRAAVHGVGASAHCWVATGEEGTYKRVSVRLGDVRGQEVVVLEGVEEGQRLLLSAAPGGAQ